MENRTINPAPPLLAGINWQVIGRNDLGALVDLAAKCQVVDGGLAFLNEPGNLEERYFSEAAGAAIGAFTAEERLVACSTVHVGWERNTECARIVGQVHPGWRERGIGAYLMRWSQRQAQALFATAVTGKRLLQIATESLTDAARRLYLAHGFEREMEQLVMRRDLRLSLPDRPMPADVTITSWQPGLAGEFFRAYDAAYRERPGFPGWSASEWISRRNEDENAKPEWSLLARVGDEPVGFLTASREHPGGFVVQIGVVPEQRRRGLGSALMVETMRRMWQEGETMTQLTVNVNNPGAIQTYAGLGFETVGRRARYERIVEG